LLKVTSGVPSIAGTGTDYEVPLTFSQSVARTTNTVTLTNDSTTPGNSKYYGTNGSGTKGFFDLPTGFDGKYTSLDFTAGDITSIPNRSYTDLQDLPDLSGYAQKAAANTFTVSPQTITIDNDTHVGLAIHANSATQSAALLQASTFGGKNLLNVLSNANPTGQVNLGDGSLFVTTPGIAQVAFNANYPPGLTVYAKQTNGQGAMIVYEGTSDSFGAGEGLNVKSIGVSGSCSGINATVIGTGVSAGIMRAVSTDSDWQGSGVLDEVAGLHIYPNVKTGSGSITNNFGIHVNSQSGVATYNYGLVLDDVGSGANDYAIASVGGKVYFGGTLCLAVTAPDASAKLQMDSTTQGFLPPRLTTTQRDAISSPAEGLIVHNSTTHAPNFYSGSAWTAIGGGSGSPGGSDTQVQFNDGGSFGGDSALVWDKTNNILSIPVDNTTSYQSRVGTFLTQSYALNNGFMSDNMYFNGSNWTRLATGYGFGFQFYNGQLMLHGVGSGPGIFTQQTAFKFDYTGKFGLGTDIDLTPGSFTGAKLLLDGSAGTIALSGATSGATTLNAPATSGAAWTFPKAATDLSATGGTGHVLKQATAGGAITSGTLSTSEVAASMDKNYVTDAQAVVIGNTSNTNSGNETASTIGVLINGSSAATPNDTDLVATAESSVLKKITWTNVKAFLKTYFDTIYATGTIPVKASGAELDTGTDDAKFATAKAIRDSTGVFDSTKAIPAANDSNGINVVDTGNQSQIVVAGTAYYITGSALTMPAASKTGGGMSTSTKMVWDFFINKTAAGTNNFSIIIYRGTNGSTADTADVTQSQTSTAVVDTAIVRVTLNVTATGATGSYAWSMSFLHKAATGAGFGTTDATPFFTGTVSSVAMNTASLKFGLGFSQQTGTPTIKTSGVVGNVFNMN
jgi:hypothetical protein